MLLKKLTHEFLEKCYSELDSQENKIKIQTRFLDPMIIYLSKKLFPQFITIVVLFIIITLLSIINLCILIKLFSTKKKIENL
jgi:hypothetical protein|tara:strand:+ start:562 stop:807 length:246 start_codon:yes stop_codon:yes gene_type:complete